MPSLDLLFAGGAETILDGRRKVSVNFPSPKKEEESTTTTTIGELLEWMLSDLLKKCERPEMLIVDGSVRPGILVLVNDVDWEILGGVISLPFSILLLQNIISIRLAWLDPFRRRYSHFYFDVTWRIIEDLLKKFGKWHYIVPFCWVFPWTLHFLLFSTGHFTIPNVIWVK